MSAVLGAVTGLVLTARPAVNPTVVVTPSVSPETIQRCKEAAEIRSETDYLTDYTVHQSCMLKIE